MNIRFFINVYVIPYIRSIAKAVFKPSGEIRMSVSNFIELWGANKIKTFVSIGANDGKKNDPIAKYIVKNNWQGVMVEPMPDNFKKLCKNYEGVSGLQFENSGISNTRDKLNFYYVKDITDQDFDWVDQVSSFDKDSFYNNISVSPPLLNRVGVMELDVMTFGDLMEKYKLDGVDLVMVDTEGYDYKVIQSIDFSVYKPKIVIFETDWLVQYEYKQLKSILRKAGYKLYFAGIDCIAVYK